MKSEINSGEALINNKKSAFLPISIYITFFLLVCMVIFFYFFSFMPISGDSMETTIHDKQYCFIQRKCFTVSRGDIVTINTAGKGENEHIIIKRVIGIEGDRLVFMISEDRYYVDIYICKTGEKTFKRLNEPYIKEPMRSTAASFNDNNIKSDDNTYISLLPYMPNLTKKEITDSDFARSLDGYTVTVAKNCIYFLGDNRNTSRDGRYYGQRSIDSVTSKIISIL